MSWGVGQLTSTDISPVAGILGTQILDGTIQTRNLAPQTILNTHIVNQTITNAQIAVATLLGSNIAPATITSDTITANTITGANISTLQLSGKYVSFDSGIIGGWTMGTTELVGSLGAIIRSGQTDFNTGTGFWLGNVAGNPKFSIGSASGNQLSWDGTYLRYIGSLAASSAINMFTYTLANLPQPPTVIGFNAPAGNE